MDKIKQNRHRGGGEEESEELSPRFIKLPFFFIHLFILFIFIFLILPSVGIMVI